MAWLFRKRIKALRGLFVNFSRSGVSLGLGVKGANISVGKRGIFLNSGIPGSGIYRRDKVASWKDINNKLKGNKAQPTPKHPAAKSISPPRVSPKQQTQPVNVKDSYLELQINNKKRIIIDNFVFGRNECRSSFGDCRNIYNKQFSIFKDQQGDWFIQGFQVPSTAKNKDGTTYQFYKTIYNGKDITNKTTKIELTGDIKIGNTEFRLTINHR